MNKVNFVDLDVKENSCKSNSGAGGPELFPEIVELPIIGQQQQKKLTESVGELNNDNISSDRLTVSQWSKGSAVINDKKLQVRIIFFQSCFYCVCPYLNCESPNDIIVARI